MCFKCNTRGHIKKRCEAVQQYNARKKVHCVQDSVADTDSDREYVFALSPRDSLEYTSLVIGGVAVQSVLIDSGTKYNIIDMSTWEELKRQRVRLISQYRGNNINRDLYGYGQSKPLELVGCFEAEIVCVDSGLKCTDCFHVYRGKGQALLSRATSEKLGVLRVGVANTNAVSDLDQDIFVKYPEVFNGVGKLNDYQLKLHIDESVQPVVQPVRRVSFGLRGKVDAKIDELLDGGIIEETKGRPTKWLSPLVVVPKGDDVRVCVDMRRANEAIVRERHPIPTVQEVMHNLNGAALFSKLDLKWGFHQIELSEESRDITSFVCDRGIFRYKRLNFGISSAPEIYQKIIQDVLKGCTGVQNIADDIIVYGKNAAEHDANLFGVLDRLRECGLTLNKRKCEFRLTKVTYFGFDVTKEGFCTSTSKIEAIVNAKRPSCVSEVRSFLGLVQFCSKFLPDYSTTSEPLRRLMRNNVKFDWGTEQDVAFKKLKELITASGTLAHFSTECKTRIVADASPTGLGAVLTQLQDNHWRVVEYASRSLSDVETRYSQTEKEALALVWAVEKFHLYVFGLEFELETDHKPLEYIFGVRSKPSARVERWVLRLQGYSYSVVYRPGKANIADTLSRLNCQPGRKIDTDFVYAVVKYSLPVAISLSELDIASAKDAELCAVRENIKSGAWEKGTLSAYQSVRSELCVYGNLVLRGYRIIIPKPLRDRVVDLAHEGHQGVVKTKNRLRSKVWWPGMDGDAERICRSCHGCQVVGELCKPQPMTRTEMPTGPWQDIAIDLMGPMPTGEHILVAVDYYSRYFEIALTKTITSTKMIELLEPMFARHGFPFSVKSDNGRCFTSDEFTSYLRDNGIEHRTSPPFFPQANGEVERQNRTLLKSIKIAHVEGRNWRVELNRLLLAYRSTPHSVTGQTPAKLMFNRELRTKLPELRKEDSILDEHVRDRDRYVKMLNKQVVDDTRNATPMDIKPGDNVLLRNTTKDNKMSTNFYPDAFVVLHADGKEVTVKSPDGKSYRRDASFVKPLVERVSPSVDTAVDNAVDTDINPAVNERPRRETKQPAYLKDYVTS